MPKFNVSVPNPLGKEEAIERIRGYVEKLVAKYQDQVAELEQSWEGESVNFSVKSYGVKVSGTGTVTDDEVQVVGDLPFTAAMFKGKIASTVEEQLKKVLG